MTVTAVAPLHDLPELVVDDLLFKVAPPRVRKTIEIVVERDASLVLKAPPAVTVERATRFVNTKRQWVYRKLVEKDALSGPPIVKRFVEGEGFAYLGRSYRLTLKSEGTGVRLDRGRFHLPAAQIDHGPEAMRRWYTEVGTQWLNKRLRPWAARLGEESVTVEVRDLGFRWGSARPHPGPQRINIHWHRLRHRPRTRPPAGNQPHSGVLGDRWPSGARLRTAQDRPRRRRQGRLARRCGRRRVDVFGCPMSSVGSAMDSGLERLGWDDAWRQVRARFDLPDSRPGRVGTVGRGYCTVLGAGGEVTAVSDSQRSQAAVSPTTGDWVLFSEDAAAREDAAGAAVIDTVLPRRTAIVRRDPAIQVTKQTLAANVDLVGILVGLDQPLNAARVERFLVLAAGSGAEPVIVLSKGDLVGEAARRRARDDLAALATGPDVLETSATEGWGLDELHRLVAPRRTFVALGPSGVGKSTLLNALVGGPVLAVGDLRGADGAGRHTTVRRELVVLPGGGVAIDTPGLRAVSLWEADLALDEVFSDIAERAEHCRFRDCTHRSEPDCAVQDAVAHGAVDAARLERYQRLWNELAQQSEARAERLRLQSRGRRGIKQRRRVRRRH